MIEEADREGDQYREGRLQQAGEPPDGSPGGRLDICCDARGIRRLMAAPSEVDAIVARLSQFATAYPHGRTAIITVQPKTRPSVRFSS